MHTHKGLAASASALALWACHGAPLTPVNADSGIPAPGADAGLLDAGPGDAGLPDGGLVDGGPMDAGTVDGGPVDAGPVMVTTLAGNGTEGFVNGSGGANGTAEFAYPAGVAVDSAGNVYVGDNGNNCIREIDPAGNVTTFAGRGIAGFADGVGSFAEFNAPSGVALDAAGNLYVADSNNNRVRKVDSSGNVTTLAGNGSAGSVDGTGGATGTAEFDNPNFLAADAAGNVFVSDLGGNRIRRVDPFGNVTTLAGNGTAGYSDGTGGPSGTAEFNGPTGVAVDRAGNVYVGDVSNNRVRIVGPSGSVTTLTGNGVAGDVDGTGGVSGSGELNQPMGLALDPQGNVYVADGINNRIRLVDPAGNVTTLAGNGTTGHADGTGGRTGTAQFDFPAGVALDVAGSLYVTDNVGMRIRKVSP